MDDELNAMEQRLITALKPRDPDPRIIQESVAETPQRRSNVEDWQDEFRTARMQASIQTG